MDHLDWKNFLDKMDHEGGIYEMMMWGGADCFPEEVYDLANIAQDALNRLLRAIESHRDDA